ncbi:hypothetical protein LGQ03_04890 [Loktanella sp. TSTF-M6]|uniref:Uncharacterized protein n=1 Tax=Loktanella gaetbuli TaxID=2881335 RepID=A0ABS8BS40_9RHOB|nr:hypothetical protein [Loktanella gaetbuli]MCB5198567.1 hypothetical protein [Loktanella gaetbuli]
MNLVPFTTSPAVQMAADAAELMTEEQRVAFAMQLILSITAPSCSQHLLRVSAQARATADQIERTRQIARAVSARNV